MQLHKICRQWNAWRGPPQDGRREAVTAGDKMPGEAGSARRAPCLYGAGRQADDDRRLRQAVTALLLTIRRQRSLVAHGAARHMTAVATTRKVATLRDTPLASSAERAPCLH